MGERILFADDEETFLYATADLLRQEGYECDCVLDGPSAIAKLEKHSYALVISDLKMPGNPNLELIHLLPQLAPRVPVILVTGYPTLRSAVQSIQLPVVAYLTKPLDFDELLKQVREAIAQSRTSQTLWRIGKQLQTWSQDLRTLEFTLPVEPRETTSVQATASPRLPKAQALTAAREDIQSVSIPTANQLRTLTELYVLSEREWEILDRLWAHQRVGTIARALFVSPHTVRNHLKSIFRKVGVHSQSELLELLAKKTTVCNS